MRFFYFLALLTVLMVGCAGGRKTPTGKPEQPNQQPDQQVLGYDEDGTEYKIKYVIVEIKGQKYIVLTSVNGWRESGICPLIEQ